MSLVIRSAPTEPFIDDAVGRDGVSPSIPPASGLGKNRAERTRSLPGGERPGRAAKAGKGGGRRVGGPGLQGDVADWWCAVGPVPSPGGLRLWNPVLGGLKQRLKIRQSCPARTPPHLPHQPFRR